MRRNRQEAILSLVENEEISTQEELMNRLKDMGFQITQATISRDIKSLKLFKTPISGGKYKYSINQTAQEDLTSKFTSILSQSIISADYAGNTAAVKCISGMAGAACEAIDNMFDDGVLGSLAGDNTIFVLCRNEQAACKFCEELKNYII